MKLLQKIIDLIKHKLDAMPKNKRNHMLEMIALGFSIVILYIILNFIFHALGVDSQNNC